MHLFVFDDAVRKHYMDEAIKLNIYDDHILHFYHNETKLIIDTDLLRDGSSTMLLYNPATDKTYVLYDFREILEVLNMTPKEMLSSLNQVGFMQIDKCNNDTFIKVFLLNGETELSSDTHNFASYKHYTTDYIHPLDWKYSWTIHHASAIYDESESKITIEFDMKRSEFWTRDIYISHAGQTQKIKEGHNKVVFTYIETEDVYLGNPNCRYKGRALDITRLLYETNR